MEKIGTYQLKDIPLSSEDYRNLYLIMKGDREVIIYCDREEPYFHVQYFAICMERTETSELYDLYKYEYFNTDDKNVKNMIKKIVESILA